MLRLWTVTLALFAFSAAALAESPTLKRIADTGQFRIGYVPDAPPLSFVDDDGNVTGYSIDLCRHIASAIRFDLGLEKVDIEFKPLVSIEDRISAATFSGPIFGSLSSARRISVVCSCSPSLDNSPVSTCRLLKQIRN